MAGRLRQQLRLPVPDRETSFALAGLAALVFALLHASLLGQGFFFERDIHMMWVGQIESFVHCVVGGSWPVWDPMIGFGRPMLANANNQILYPPTWLNLVVRPWVYFTLYVAFHYLLSAIGVFALGRLLRLSAAASFVAAAIWIASGPFASTVAIWNHFAGAAWLPWSLVAAERAQRRPGPISLCLGAVSLARPILAGSPESFLAAAILGAAWTATMLSRPILQPANARRIAVLAGACGLALGLSAGQWLPTLELARASARASSVRVSAWAWSLHPVMLTEVVLPFRWGELPLLPHLLGQWLGNRAPLLRSIHLGLPALALALSGLLAPRRGRAFFAAVVALAVLIALGDHGLLAELLVFLVPPLGMLRFPVKAMVVAALGWSVLAGMGFEVWHRSGLPPRRLGAVVMAPLWALLVLTLAGLTLATAGADWVGPALLYHGPGFPPYPRLLEKAASGLSIAAVLGAASLGLLWIRRAATRQGPKLSLALAGLAIVSLVLEHQSLHPLVARSLYTERPPVLSRLGEIGDGRVYVYDYAVKSRAQQPEAPLPQDPFRLARIPVGWTTLAAFHLAAQRYLQPPTGGRFGVHGSYDLDLMDLFPPYLDRLTQHLREKEASPTHLRMLQMGAVVRVLGLDRRPFWNDLLPVATVTDLMERPIQVMAVPDPLPRAYAVGGARVAADADALAILDRPDFDPRRELILADGEPRAAPDGFRGRVTFRELGPDRVRLEAELSHPGWVVLVDGYEPGWHARLDGVAVPLLRANLAFRAVAVGAGRHVIEQVYRPRSVTVGLILSGLFLILCLAAAMGPRSTGRPGGGPISPPLSD